MCIRDSIKGEIKFISSETFTTQINSGVSNVAVTDALTNGYVNVNRSKTGEVVTIDGAEWIHKAGEFNWLEKVPKKMWGLISKSTRKKK